MEKLQQTAPTADVADTRALLWERYVGRNAVSHNNRVAVKSREKHHGDEKEENVLPLRRAPWVRGGEPGGCVRQTFEEYMREEPRFRLGGSTTPRARWEWSGEQGE